MRKRERNDMIVFERFGETEAGSAGERPARDSRTGERWIWGKMSLRLLALSSLTTVTKMFE
jgi:hypothetical protein